MKKTSTSFPKRLSLNVLFITSALFVIAILIAGITSHKLIADEATKSATNMLNSISSEIGVKIADVESAVRNLAWVAVKNADDDQALYDLTVNMVKENPYIVGSAIAFRENYHPGERFFAPYAYTDSQLGTLISTQLGNKNYDYFYMDWYLIPTLLKKPVWSEPYFDEGGGDQYMASYSLPVFDPDGEVLAVVTADINLGWLSELVAGIKPYENSYMYLISRTGSFIAATDIQSLEGETIFSIGEGRSSSSLLEISSAMTRGEKGIKRYMDGSKASFAVYCPLLNGWSAMLSCQYKDVLARTSQMHFLLLIIGIIGLLLLFVLCYFAVKRLAKPLVQLSGAAMNIAGGDFNTPLPELKVNDEIGKLRTSFEYMQKHLRNYIDELKVTTSAKERFESELHIARSIQMHMVPRNFNIKEGVDLFAILQPAKEVGGDLYDFFVKDGYLYFAIGDVSGKGVPASMFMAITRSAFRFIAGMDIPINEVMSKINNSVSNGNDSGMFVTMFAARLNLKNGVMEYCNAGHNRIIIKNPDGSARFLDQKANLAIGVFEGFPYEKQETTIAKGSSLILYTDGVTEAEAADKSQFGDEALLAWAESVSSEKSAEQTVEDLISKVKEFTNGNDQNDDITILSIKA